MLIWILLIQGIHSQLAYITQVLQNIANQNCSKSSPKYDIQYGKSQLHTQSGIYFCDQYAKRTCCSQQNFDELKLKWFREYQQIIELSQQCHEVYLNTVCSDCDGDIGQQIRKGFCPSLCTRMYQSCQTDLFQFDEKTQKLRFCQQNDVVCAQLHTIVTGGEQFCSSLGYKVNYNENLEEFIENKYLQLPTQALCWNGQASSKFWNFGPPIKLPETKSTTKQRKQAQEETSYSMGPIIIAIISCLLLVIVFAVLKK